MKTYARCSKERPLLRITELLVALSPPETRFNLYRLNRHFQFIISTKPHKHQKGKIQKSLIRPRKPRLKEVDLLAQSHRARKGESQGIKPGLLDSRTSPLLGKLGRYFDYAGAFSTTRIPLCLHPGLKVNNENRFKQKRKAQKPQ